MMRKNYKFLLIFLFIGILIFGLSACDSGSNVPDVVTITFEAANDASYVYEDIEVNGTNLGDDLPIKTDVETGGHNVTWYHTLLGSQNGYIEVSHDGQTFILDISSIYQK